MLIVVLLFLFFYFVFLSLGGKCAQSVELSGENINIAYKHDGTNMAVGNRVIIYFPLVCLFRKSNHDSIGMWIV